ncbi:DUF4345 domain-containing protein [Streptomyces sp. NBC_00083]|uniref:DUF4345 domain-containing protein n=1 Tax=Streptomyces sp. NBC_00083 TaxID=2975647 RepID=UPI00224DC4E2|nr:DUF4345 domain-containing protein [Streptomyces sp. NBC_00083]MCX5384109.1 DUF4345 domain-containing protein [Streptomyces sp. NBC_00083]
MARLLMWLSWAMGIADVAIGATHLIVGVASVPGAGSPGPTVDSLMRFFGAIFLGYGLAWIWVARQSPIPSNAVRLLAGVFFLGGAARLLSWAALGRPDWFQLVLMGIELALPPLYFWLASADERDTAARRWNAEEAARAAARSTP